MMNSLQISKAWQKYFGHPKGAKLGAINAIYPAGKVCGALVAAPFSNRYGRKSTFILGAVICIVGAAIQAGSVNLGMLIFSRWFLGVGTATVSQPSPILIAELAYPTHRGKVTALYNTFYVSSDPSSTFNEGANVYSSLVPFSRHGQPTVP